ncbi:MAG TPA: ribonuclease HII [Candidatus Nitrosocosmicus sp.]|nr:ribonuclease HII [Candidatus Nitrosocosmicus sp.]
MLLGGIDEAGRGSVIGPLVIAGVSLDKENIRILQGEGVLDSKSLTPRTREKLYPKIILRAKSMFVCKIKPKIIDSYVQLKKLNSLEVRFMTLVSDNLVVDKIIFDACDVNLDRFKRSILENMKNKSVKIYCFHKADQDNTAVAAASIIAKVTRDREISLLETRFGIRIGSGYPSDPITKTFLKDNVQNKVFKEHIRFTWAPVKLLANKEYQTKLL